MGQWAFYWNCCQNPVEQASAGYNNSCHVLSTGHKFNNVFTRCAKACYLCLGTERQSTVCLAV